MPQFCMLGKQYSEKLKINFPCIVTEKLDGVRRILSFSDQLSFYSKTGKKDIFCKEILEEARRLPRNYVYDGELLAIGHFHNCIAHRQATISIANRKSIKNNLIFHIFDMIPYEEFYSDSCEITAIERKNKIDDIIDNSFVYIKKVPILGIVNSLEEANIIAEDIWSIGGEGVMLNTLSGLYRRKRTNDLIKIKKTFDYVLNILDFFEGQGRLKGKLGGIICNYNDNILAVGSGFTDEQRDYIWKNKDQYIDRQIEIETFGSSIDLKGNNSLNCPIFKRFIGDD